MVTRFFSNRAAIQRMHEGPLGRHVDCFAQQLFEQHFARRSTRAQILDVAELSRWLARHSLGAADLDPNVIDKYLQHRLRRRRLRRGHRAALLRLLGMLRKQGIAVQRPRHRDPSPLDHIEEDFKRFLSVERGLAPATLVNYVPLVNRFLSERFGQGPIQLAQLRATDIIDFVRRHANDSGPGRTKLMLTALRSFLRHLQHRGDIGADLAACVPCVPRWSLTEVPKFLQPGAVEQILKHCDRGSSIGMRDYAILLLLARLGLRASEVVSLTLDDIDWHSSLLKLHCKCSRSAQVPLISEVGEALASYLQRGRPACTTRRVFVRERAPQGGFANSSAICCVVDRALSRAGINSARRGAHLLRHTLATEMLRRGASLSEIGRVLRHRHPDTTLIYAKVDLRALRPLALPWPGDAQ
jgi:site-specific recombinase XerD